MTVIDTRLEALQGEKFSQIMSGFDFATASQIVILLYDKESTAESGFAKAFVKVADGVKYPSAGLITDNGGGKMIFTIDTTGMSIGNYDIEIRVDVTDGSSIVKQRVLFLTIKESRT